MEHCGYPDPNITLIRHCSACFLRKSSSICALFPTQYREPAGQRQRRGRGHRGKEEGDREPSNRPSIVRVQDRALQEMTDEGKRCNNSDIGTQYYANPHVVPTVYTQWVLVRGKRGSKHVKT